MRKVAKIRGILCDMDGVLVDSEPIDRKAWAMVMRKYGIEVSEEELLNLVGKPTRAVLEYFRHRSQVPLDDDVLTDKSRLFYTIAASELRPMPGVQGFLEEARLNNIRLAVASSSDIRRIQFSLLHTGLISYFEVLCSGEDVPHPKPAPDVFLAAAKKLSLSSSECVVIEDSIHGIVAAKSAGMRVFGYSSSFSADELRTAGSDVVFSSFLGLQNHLHNLLVTTIS